jgi:diacylglycerol O-acyltransferase
MNDEHNHECLSYGDALFLYLERDGMPLNVASVSEFDGHIGRDECLAFMESKLPVLPRYRQRVVMPPMNLGLPCWEYDPSFDLGNHICEVELKRGTDAELKAVAGKLLSSTMDRNRPLWDFTLVQGVKNKPAPGETKASRGTHTALIVRVHHCLADGISGVSMLATVMDSTPVTAPAPPVKKFRAPKPSGVGERLIDGAVTTFFSSIQRFMTAQAELLEFAQRLAHSMGDLDPNTTQEHGGLVSQQAAFASLHDITRYAPELAAPAGRMPFNVVCRGPQKFEWAQLSLHEIKEVKRQHGATVNDVFLTVVTAAVRRYAELHRTRTTGGQLRVIVPVSIRGKDNMRELGNRITFLPVTIPFAKSPRRLIALVHERTAFLKSSHLAEVVGFFGTVLGAVPPAVQALLGPIASALPIPAGNIICTQVPGPREPLYLMGRRMLNCYPYVPIGGEFGLNVAVLTYNDVAHFGFSADTHAVPDAECLPRLLVEAFDQLKKVSGVKSSRPASVAPVPGQADRKQPETAEKVRTKAAAGD